MGILYLIVVVIVIAGIWKTFEKAGQPGWAAIVPFYNYYIMAKIGGVKNWWFVFIPFLNIYILFVISIAIAKSFGKDTGFGLGLALLGFIFYPILGFGSSVYKGADGSGGLAKDIESIGSGN
ncbi:MAG: DUF5684 domain-containing protein [Sphingobacteriales bacterium]|jgi:hypothetical protein|nr:DUF5684 domain-containing protein [Sphingobacteriales bacterium]